MLDGFFSSCFLLWKSKKNLDRGENITQNPFPPANLIGRRASRDVVCLFFPWQWLSKIKTWRARLQKTRIFREKIHVLLFQKTALCCPKNDIDLAIPLEGQKNRDYDAMSDEFFCGLFFKLYVFKVGNQSCLAKEKWQICK